MNMPKSHMRRLTLLSAAFLVLFDVAGDTLFVKGRVNALTLTSRKMTMTSTELGNQSTDPNGAAASAGTPYNGQKAYYKFTFNIGTSGQSVGSMAILFCKNSPLPQTTCTPPDGMDATHITGTVTSTGFTSSNAWSVDTGTSVTTGYFATGQCSGRTNCVLLKQASTPATVTLTPQINFTLGSSSSIYITNPTQAEPFYARIVTFSDTAFTNGNDIDDGGVAGSVNTSIDITSKVQETLNFSTTATTPGAPGSTCTALTGSGSIALGDTNGVLNVGTAYNKFSYFRLSTNANSGTSVQYAGDTLKTAAGLAINQIGNTATAANTGGTQDQFGMTLDSSDGNYSFTNLTRTAPYSGDNTYAFNSSSLTTPIPIASAASGTAVACDTGSVKYLGVVLPTTKPGIYKTRIDYFAVPTY